MATNIPRHICHFSKWLSMNTPKKSGTKATKVIFTLVSIERNKAQSVSTNALLPVSSVAIKSAPKAAGSSSPRAKPRRKASRFDMMVKIRYSMAFYKLQC